MSQASAMKEEKESVPAALAGATSLAGAAAPASPTPAAAHEAGRMAAFCPVYANLMDLLSRRWMGLVLRVLMAGPHRFSQILAAVPGLSDPLLAQRLRELEAKALVKRSVLPTTPVHVQYELTEAGQDLERAVRALSDWASKWWGDAGGAPAATGHD
jgi:DNA-binding HxlR family transcriptional regulator